jgi:hypothetical protein
MQNKDQPALLDELFIHAQEHRNSRALHKTFEFLAQFKSQKPYNAYLLRLQNPRVTFVKTAVQWRRDFGREIDQDAKPLLILFPFSPLIIVFDIMDTSGEETPQALLEWVNLLHPARGQVPHRVVMLLLKNAENHGILVCKSPMNLLQQGQARRMTAQDYRDLEQGRFLSVVVSESIAPLFTDHVLESQRIQVKKPRAFRYLVEVSDVLNDPLAFATLAHELAHIVLGHLGADGNDPWKNRNSQYPRNSLVL